MGSPRWAADSHISQRQVEDPSTHLDLQDITFTAIAPDADGGLLLSGLGDNVLRERSGRFDTILGAGQGPGTVISMAATPDKSVWLGTQDNGLFRLLMAPFRCHPGSEDLKINCLFRPTPVAYGSAPTMASTSGKVTPSRRSKRCPRSRSSKF